MLITIYKWYEKNERINHNSFFTESYGVDTLELDSAIMEMRKTNFFSREFLINYKQVGQRTNQMLQLDSTLKMVGISFPFQDFDTWRGGQGSSPKWDDLIIMNLLVNEDQASFKWTATHWDTLNVRFKKENNQWKLAYLELLDLKMYQ
ncbi:MAG: hypothetical protein ACKO96_26190 [Flammeovirgaceae bacterium]